MFNLVCEGKENARARGDNHAVQQSCGAGQRLEPRWVATLFGRMRVWHTRLRSKIDKLSPAR